MRRTSLGWKTVAALLALTSIGLASCSKDSGYVYRGPKLPGHTQPAAASLPPPEGRGVTRPTGAAAEAAASAGGEQTGEPAARVLAPVPRARAEGPSGPVVVLAPERPEEVNIPEDPRTPTEVARDKAAWDRCVLNAAVKESEDVTSRGAPVGRSPEEICAQSLGMADRGAIPRSRQRR